MNYGNSINTQLIDEELLIIKQRIAATLNYSERLEIINYLSNLDKCDIISKLPVSLSTMILQQFTPEELGEFRLGITLENFIACFFKLLTPI